ncbi:MAG: UPF0147 family protein [Theionarchaea archaeon]|nr:UPF0147 family protein [Theionarchaea archaeon]
MAEIIKEICESLEESVVQDPSVPRNIRKAASEAIEHLRNQTQSRKVRAHSATEILDEISNDPNMPMHTRTIIWQVLTELERIED